MFKKRLPQMKVPIKRLMTISIAFAYMGRIKSYLLKGSISYSWAEIEAKF
jgi:hypothetical protein